MSVWGRAWGDSWGLSWGLTYEANQEEGCLPAIYKQRERTVLVTKNGARFQVPESELHKWVDEQTEEVVTEAKETIRKSRRFVVKSSTDVTESVTPDVIATESDQNWIQRLIEEANRRIYQQLIEYRKMLDDDDEECLLLAL